MKLNIFTIATGQYKNYLDNFLNSLHNFFPNEQKELIILSDGLKEKNNTYINDNIHISVYEIIDLPYPYINMNKFQILNEYSKKLNCDYIIYFDSDTIFLEKDLKFWETLSNDILSNKFIGSIHPFYANENLLNNYKNIYEFMALGDENIGYRHFNENDYLNFNFINDNNIWIITSFFIINKDMLNEVANKIKILINKSNRSYLKHLKFSDESHFNLLYYFDYLNNKIDELYVIKKYIINDSELKNTSEDIFIIQKYNDDNKVKIKNCNTNTIILIYVDEYFDDKLLYQLYSKYIYDFTISCISKNSNEILLKYVYNKYLFGNVFNFWDVWFNEKNILFYSDFYDSYLNIDGSQYDNVFFIKKLNNDILNIDLEKLQNNNVNFKSDKTIEENIDFENINYMYYNIDFMKNFIANKISYNT